MSRRLRAASLAAALSFMALSMTRPLLPLLALRMGASEVQLGGVVAAQAFLPIFLAVPLGALADKLPHRSLVAAGAAVMGLYGLGVALIATRSAGHLWMLFGAETLLGLAHLLEIVALQTYVSMLHSDRRREEDFGTYSTYTAAGQLVGPPLGGFLADTLGFGAAFAAAGMTGLLPAVAGLGMKSPFGAPARGALRSGYGRGPGIRWSQVRAVLKEGGVQAAMASSFAVIFVLGVRQAFYPVYVQGLGYSATTVGTLLALQAITSMAIRALLPRLTRTLGRFRLTVACFLAASLGIGLIPLMRNGPALALGSLVVGASTGLVMPLSLLVVAEHTSDRLRGLAMGVRLTGNRLAQLLNPLLFGWIAERWDIPTAFYAGGAVIGATAAIFFRWRDVVEVPSPEESRSSEEPEPAMPRLRSTKNL